MKSSFAASQWLGLLGILRYGFFVGMSLSVCIRASQVDVKATHPLWCPVASCSLWHFVPVGRWGAPGQEWRGRSHGAQAACDGKNKNYPELIGPCSVAGHVLTLPWVRSRVAVRVRLGSGLASGKGWVSMWPVTRFDPTTTEIYIYRLSIQKVAHILPFHSQEV